MRPAVTGTAGTPGGPAIVPDPTPPASGAELLADLDRRGLRHDSTDPVELVARLDRGPTRLYCGFDPTADSLHLGNLQSIMLLRRFQLAGHAPIALVGGATGMIGDPGGRTEERVFLDLDVLDRNRAAIGQQLTRFLDFGDDPTGALLVDNRSWTESMGVLEFLRDVGKHVTVNTMLARDSVRSRLDRESGISFTEFSYMLLQANDFLQLHLSHGCDLQVAGSDQWGNIATGVDLVRRRTGDTVHGLTAPLILRADGTKFGKSEGDNVWLSGERTSPYRFYQFLLNVPDDDVPMLLLRLTTLTVEECERVAAAHRAAPHERSGQRRLAHELTSLVHGTDVAEQVARASAVLFGRPLDELDPAALDLLADEVPTSRRSPGEVLGADPVDLVASTPLAGSKGEVRRTLSGYYLNQTSLAERGPDPIGDADLLHGRFVLLRRGRSTHHLVVVD
jgi:tyrosyl-tRNA synthetase